ncbi:MAG TPA: hypothetical protein VFQ45_14615 [Longimicrobium sp.]|nr:hypothetical protein [Longimicrobium sp.]
MDPFRDPFALPADTGYGMPGDPMEQVLSLQTYNTTPAPPPDNVSYGCIYAPGGTYGCTTYWCETYDCITVECATWQCIYGDRSPEPQPIGETW